MNSSSSHVAKIIFWLWTGWKLVLWCLWERSDSLKLKPEEFWLSLSFLVGIRLLACSRVECTGIIRGFWELLKWLGNLQLEVFLSCSWVVICCVTEMVSGFYLWDGDLTIIWLKEEPEELWKTVGHRNVPAWLRSCAFCIQPSRDGDCSRRWVLCNIPSAGCKILPSYIYVCIGIFCTHICVLQA